jgi:3-hydroxy acid dehydrogenase / malonic semialdehyde reductase
MNKIVLITGATSGFGKATALAFAKQGDHLIITGRRNNLLLSFAAELTDQYKVKVLPLCFDVQKRSEVDAAIASLNNSWKNIDILVNNAGLALGRDDFDEGNMDDWETMIDTNLKGLLYVTKAVVPVMRERKSGHIINIGSVAGKEVYDKGNVYCATKHAVDAISKAMRIDLLKYGIKVSAIHPGAAETEFGIVRFKGDAAKASAVYAGYEPLHADDIADAILYMANVPAHVCINDMVITCTAQGSSMHWHKRN